MSPDTPTCPTCGQPADGKFCSNCGSPLAPSHCPACRTTLGAGARFCHACGHPLGGRRRRTPGATPTAIWIAAAGAAVLILGIASIWNSRATATPAGNPNTTIPGPPPSIGAGAPPDISNLSPRQQADRLFDRIMQAAEAGDSSTATFFRPMAVSAYSQLPALDSDARYHLGLIHVVTGDRASALAQLDSLRAEAPNHLFAPMLAFTLAQENGDRDGMRAAYSEFLNDYDSEIAAGRLEYEGHRSAIDLFRQSATAGAGVNE